VKIQTKQARRQPNAVAPARVVWMLVLHQGRYEVEQSVDLDFVDM
jgi:hypothetical protein